MISVSMTGIMKVMVITIQYTNAPSAGRERRGNMSDERLKVKYYGLLNAIGYARGSNWKGALKRRFQLKALHNEIVKRGLTV